MEQINVIVDGITKKIADLKEGFATKEAVTNLEQNITKNIAAVKSEVDNINKAVVETASKIDLMTGKMQPEKNQKSMIRQALEDFFAHDNVTGSIKDGTIYLSQTNPGASLKANVILKAGETMFLEGLAAQQSVFNQAVTRDYFDTVKLPAPVTPSALDILPKRRTSSQYMTILYYKNYEGVVEFAAEGTAASASSRIEIDSKDFRVLDITADVDFTANLLDDQKALIDYLEELLVQEIKITLDKKVFSTGGDNSITPWGAFNTTHSATLFNPLQYEGKEPNATSAHVIKWAKAYAKKYSSLYAPGRGYNPNVAFISENTKLGIESLENTDTDSRNLRWIVYNNEGELVRIAGMATIGNPQIGDNEMLIATSNTHQIGIRKDAVFEMGYIGDNFKKRIPSMLMSFRMAYAVKDAAANIYVSDIANAITILSATPAESLARVIGYADGSDATELTIQTLINAGVTDTDPTKLAAYKTAIEGATIVTLADLQLIIDTVNAA